MTDYFGSGLSGLGVMVDLSNETQKIETLKSNRGFQIRRDGILKWRHVLITGYWW
jgi:hypothetical protein